MKTRNQEQQQQPAKTARRADRGARTHIDVAHLIPAPTWSRFADRRCSELKRAIHRSGRAIAFLSASGHQQNLSGRHRRHFLLKASLHDLIAASANPFS